MFREKKDIVRIPKRYEKRVREAYRDADGYWLYLNPGWNREAAGAMGLHIIHQYSEKEMLKSLKLTGPCECKYCYSKTK